MDTQAYVFIVLLHLFILQSFGASSSSIKSNIGLDYGITSLNRSSFPSGFLFGTASSAYQYEGAAFEDGRKLSIWDTFTHKFPGKIADGSNGDVAVDSYHRYKEDVRIMKEMGVDAYRFSISWSRVLPYGKLSKGVNEKGLMYYHNLINELLANGIKPFVTLFHWDLPQFLEDEYGGFRNSRIVDDFRDYADLCFREFGNKVKHWITLNEPWSYSAGIYAIGILSSHQCSKVQLNCTDGDRATKPYLVAHQQLLSHATAVELYRRKYQAYQKGIIGISLNSNWFVPFSQARHHREAALRALDWMFGWFMDPMTYGDYPHSMRSLVGSRLPKFSKEQSRIIKGSYDFVGLNYYTSNYAAYASSLKTAKPDYSTDAIANLTTERHGIPIGPRAASDWLFVYPSGLLDLLLYAKKRYKNPLIYITENGIDEASSSKVSLTEALSDNMRIEYYHSHFAFLQRAIKAGVDVRGYFAWSLLDNFEWAAGYAVRFGMNYVDYKNGLKRYPKLSAKWFKEFLQ